MGSRHHWQPHLRDILDRTRTEVEFGNGLTSSSTGAKTGISGGFFPFHTVAQATTANAAAINANMGALLSFSIQESASSGYNVYVTGSTTELGSWTTAHKLTWNVGENRFDSKSSVSIDPGAMSIIRGTNADDGNAGLFFSGNTSTALNHYFGMHLSASFTTNSTGAVGNGSTTFTSTSTASSS